MWIQRMPLLVMVAGSAKGSSGVTGTAGPRRTGRTGRRGDRMTGTSGRSRAVPGDSSVSVVLPIPHDDILPEAWPKASGRVYTGGVGLSQARIRLGTLLRSGLRTDELVKDRDAAAVGDREVVPIVRS